VPVYRSYARDWAASECGVACLGCDALPAGHDPVQPENNGRTYNSEAYFTQDWYNFPRVRCVRHAPDVCNDCDGDPTRTVRNRWAHLYDW